MRWFACLWMLLPLSAVADERILSFDSDILIKADGWIEVRETIRVRAEGQQIRRGIYREFPTRYTDRRGLDYVVDYRPLAVLRNGSREDFHSVNVDNGVITYFGHRDRYIASGEHTYQYSYEANRMVGFFDNHDELYWNVTGNDWAFPIDRASATIRFEVPVDAATLRLEAYTGRQGDTGSAYRADVDAAGYARFIATEVLPPVHGMTVVVGFPKGLITEPTGIDRLAWALRDNRDLLVVVAGFLALFAYYLPVWRHFGKDPEEGVIVTRYTPPAGYSPASLRFVRQMYYDNKVMTAAVLNLAVKGYLRIDTAGGKHVLERLTPSSDAPPLAAGERELYDGLFRSGTRVSLENENHRRLGRAKSAHRTSLDDDYRRKYFQNNGLLNVPGAVIVIASSVVALTITDRPPGLVILAIAANVAVVVFFGWIMRRPTLRGRKLLDEMLGFRDYLDVAEKDELNLRNPPEKTPQLFEAYLPFALALGVEQRWAEKFADVLAAVRDDKGRPYRPGWYGGDFNVARLHSATGAVTSGLNRAISSSVTPPGSSSGGGGGGSSGGGGGGGGGGGW
jgi:uncharacterized membrane protein YgcG